MRRGHLRETLCQHEGVYGKVREVMRGRVGGVAVGGGYC
jgi:hypothetical protein